MSWDPSLFWIHGIYCVSQVPFTSQSFSHYVCTCHEKTSAPPSPFLRHNPRVTGDLFESRYYHPRDCEAYLVGRRIFPSRRKRRGNTLEFRRWMERNPSFDGSKSELFVNRISDGFLWTILDILLQNSCIRYINYFRLMENRWLGYVHRQDKC